jgi:glutaredoxin
MTPKTKEPKKIKFFLLLLSIVGLILITLEIYLNSQQKTLCQSEGCSLVHIFNTYHLLNYTGFLLFFYLTIVSFLDLLEIKLIWLLNLRTYILALAIIVEGYFIGFQKWILNEYCSYCLTVASLIFLCFLLDYKLPLKEKALFSGGEFSKNTSIYKIAFLGSLSLFLATFLVKIPLKPLEFNSPVLIYKKDCPHCEEVKKFAKEHNIFLKLYDVNEAISLIRLLKYNNVPILIYKEIDKTLVIEGEDNIKNWLKEKYGIEEKESLGKEYEKPESTEIKRIKKEKSQIKIEGENLPIGNNSSQGACIIDQQESCK